MNRSTGIRLLFTALLLVMFTLPSALAQPNPSAPVVGPSPQVIQRYAVSRVAVAAGGVPVRETRNGVLYAPTLNDNCLPNETPSTWPLAGTLSSEVKLDVSVVACQQTTEPEPEAPEPKVTCEWVLDSIDLDQYQGSPYSFTGTQSCGKSKADQLSGSQSWKGFEGQVIIRLPDKVSIHELKLTCKIQDEISKPAITTSLFSTYSEPLTVVSPPKASWYALSACWSSGLSLKDGEGDVLRALQRGIYSYGGQLWRYGYGTEVAQGLYTFPLFESDGGGRAVLYEIDNEELRPNCSHSGKCKCRWQGLVEPGALCNFGDCYVFSDVLQSMAAVMGIGGLRYQAIRGKAGLGFLTHEATSLDPSFPQSVSCQENHEKCFPYYFSNHSLRLRDGVYYDSTFLKTYTSPEQAVALNRALSDSPLLNFIKSNVVLHPSTSVYGNWKFYTESSVKTFNPSRNLAIDISKAKFSTIDYNKDGLYEALRAKVRVRIISDGSYLIYALLSSEDGQLVADQPDWWTTQPTVGTVVGKSGQRKTLELNFSGQEIYQSNISGTYKFSAIFYDDTKPIRVYSTSTPSYESNQFGELAAAIRKGTVEVEGIRLRPGSHFDHLKITVPFQVWQEGRFTLEARLAKNNKTIAYAGRQEKFAPGNYSVDLKMVGEKIAVSGQDGPYELTIIYYDEHQAAKTSIQQSIDGFEAVQFAPSGSAAQ